MRAVTGSKNLKTIIVRDTQTVRVALPRESFELTARVRQELNRDAGTKSLSAMLPVAAVAGVPESAANAPVSSRKRQL